MNDDEKKAICLEQDLQPREEQAQTSYTRANPLA